MGGGRKIHKRLAPHSFEESLRKGVAAVRGNLVLAMIMTFATDLLILAIPVCPFQISDRVLTSRSVDTLIMLTVVIAGAVILQAVFDAVRRFMLMRTAVEVAAQLSSPILSAAAHGSLHGSGREYQTLGDLQQLRSFLTSGTLISFLDVPSAPLFVLAILLVHPHPDRRAHLRTVHCQADRRQHVARVPRGSGRVESAAAIPRTIRSGR
jgi:ATP-binding cassette subfamily C protein